MAEPISKSNAASPAVHGFVPTQFGRYRIERELGRGAMGCVYLAEDTQLGRKVALKIPQRMTLEQPEALERFYREARTTSTLQHPNICPVYDVGCIDGVHYLTMAYILGKPVSSFIGKGKLPAARQVALLIRKIALALDEAHRNGIIHRDLKPANIMLNDRGEPVVMDFGLAVQLNTAENSRLTQSGSILGTPAYMSPEQVLGEIHRIGPASDIYALGVIMYQFLTGELPFTGPMMMVCAQIISNQARPPSGLRPDVDPVLEAICLKMMAKDIDQRFSSMKEVAAALGQYLKAGPVSGIDSTSTSAPTYTVADAESSLDNLAMLSNGAENLGSIDLRTRNPQTLGSHNILDRMWKRRWLLAGSGLAFIVLLNTGIGLWLVQRTTLERRRAPVTLKEPGSIPIAANLESTPTGVETPLFVAADAKSGSAPPLAVVSFDASQARAHQQAWAKHLNLPVEFTNSIGMKFRLIPPGEFWMGATASEIGRVLKKLSSQNKRMWGECFRSEGPRHKVILTEPFYLGIQEVMQSQYERVIGINPSNFSPAGAGKDFVTSIDTNNHPVEMVSWNDAVRFCEELSRLEGDEESETQRDVIGYHLPTEAQWEFSCRSGAETKFSTGDNAEDLKRVGRFGVSVRGRTYAVGGLQPNAFGLYDMHGNVWEWVQDAWKLTTYEDFKDEPAIDPCESSSADDRRVIRGGDWHDPADNCRCSSRIAYDGGTPWGNVGFRVILSVDAVRMKISGRIPKADAKSNRFLTEESLPKGRVIDLATDLSMLSDHLSVAWKDEGLEVNSPNRDKAWTHSFAKYAGCDMILRGELQLLDGDQVWVAQRASEKGKYHFALRRNGEFFVGVEAPERSENDVRSQKSDTSRPVRFTFATIGDQILLFLDGKMVAHKFSTDSTLEYGVPSIGVYAGRARFSNLSLELLDVAN